MEVVNTSNKGIEEENTPFDTIPGEIFCVFKTNLEEQYHIDEVPLNIKTSLTEKELSQVNPLICPTRSANLSAVH